MIHIEGVTRRFGRATAVDGVSLEIAAGESVALWGMNGAGKTTLIRCVLGLLRFEGRISIGGHDVRRQGKSARMLVGYVPQELGFYDDLRVGEAVLFFARLKGAAVRSTGQVLADVGLADHAHKRIRELSGGMKQRLALAIAMLGDPPVLVLDEVTASLDACGRSEFVALLAGLSGTGRTLLFASHRIEEISALAKRVVVLDRGRMASQCGVEQFASQFGQGVLLHLSMRQGDRAPAMALLAEHGFAPRMNGIGIVVPVAAQQKAAPLRVLAQARISIDDFGLSAEAPAHDGAAEKEGTP